MQEVYLKKNCDFKRTHVIERNKLLIELKFKNLFSVFLGSNV